MDGFVGEGGMPKPVNGYVASAPFPNKPIQKGQGNEFPCGVEGHRPSWGPGRSPGFTSYPPNANDRGHVGSPWCRRRVRASSMPMPSATAITEEPP